MIDDAKIRLALLERFPQIEPHTFEMEEYEYGDDLGVTWLTHQDGGGMVRLRARVVAKNRTAEDITDELAEAMKAWFAPSIMVETAAETALYVKRGPGRPRKAA